MGEFFTSKEKVAIVNVLHSIMKADDMVDDSEQKYMNVISQRLGITNEEMNAAQFMEESECKNVLGNLPENLKSQVNKCFLDMVGADGKVDLRELRVIYNLTN